MSKELLKQQKALLTETWKPANRSGMWPIDGINGKQESYDRTFERLIRRANADSLDSLLDRMGTKGKPVNVLDVMGGGYFLERPERAGHIFALRLDDVDAALQARYATYASSNTPIEAQRGTIFAQKLQEYQVLTQKGRRHVVTGNVLESRTWNALDTSMHASGVEALQIITCRPQGPFRVPMSSSVNVEIFVELYNQMICRLAPNGYMFAQVPRALDDRKDELAQRLQGNHKSIVTHIDQEPPTGAYVVYDDPVMMVYKNQ